MMGNGYGCFGSGFPMMMGGGMWMMILFWGLIIWLIIYAIRKWSPNDKSNQTDKAIDILRERYSMGEISKEEFRERLEELTDKANKN